MTSAKDRSIMAALVKFPDLKEQDVNNLISKLDSHNDQRIMRAYLGQMPAESLDAPELIELQNLRDWAEETLTRVRVEQLKAREAHQETQFAKNMIERHRRGEITDKTLMIYAISGPLPERPTTQEELHKIRTQMIQRTEKRLGRYYWEHFDELPSFFEGAPNEDGINWLLEGF